MQGITNHIAWPTIQISLKSETSISTFSFSFRIGVRVCSLYAKSQRMHSENNCKLKYVHQRCRHTNKKNARGGGGGRAWRSEGRHLKSVDCLKSSLYVFCGVTTNKRIAYSLSEGQKLRLPEATQLYGRLIVGALLFRLFFQLKRERILFAVGRYINCEEICY